MSSTRLSIEDLKALVQEDVEAVRFWQIRIDELRKDFEKGNIPKGNELSGISTRLRTTGRHLIQRIEQIETQKNRTATDRDMLQQLEARVGAHDLLRSKLTELERDIRTWLHQNEMRGAEQSQRYSNPAYSGRQRSEDKPATPSAKRSSSSSSKSTTTSIETNVSESIGAMPDPVRSTTSAGNDQHYGENDGKDVRSKGEQGEANRKPSIGRSDWPILYRILDIDPKTPEYLFKATLDEYASRFSCCLEN